MIPDMKKIQIAVLYFVFLNYKLNILFIVTIISTICFCFCREESKLYKSYDSLCGAKSRVPKDNGDCNFVKRKEEQQFFFLSLSEDMFTLI